MQCKCWKKGGLNWDTGRVRRTLDTSQSLLSIFLSFSVIPLSFFLFSLLRLLLFLFFFFLPLPVSPSIRSLSPCGLRPFRRGHSTAITKRCRKPAIVILVVYCASRFSSSREETIISDRMHCVHCITQSHPMTDGRPGPFARPSPSPPPRVRARARATRGCWWWLEDSQGCCQGSFVLLSLPVNYT